MKFLTDIKSTFDSIVFEWDETKSNIQNVHDFVTIFLKITDPYNKISTRIMEHSKRAIKLAERLLNKEVADKELKEAQDLMDKLKEKFSKFNKMGTQFVEKYKSSK